MNAEFRSNCRNCGHLKGLHHKHHTSYLSCHWAIYSDIDMVYSCECTGYEPVDNLEYLEDKDEKSDKS